MPLPVRVTQEVLLSARKEIPGCLLVLSPGALRTAMCKHQPYTLGLASSTPGSTRSWPTTKLSLSQSNKDTRLHSLLYLCLPSWLSGKERLSGALPLIWALSSQATPLLNNPLIPRHSQGSQKKMAAFLGEGACLLDTEDTFTEYTK